MSDRCRCGSVVPRFGGHPLVDRDVGRIRAPYRSRDSCCRAGANRAPALGLVWLAFAIDSHPAIRDLGSLGIYRGQPADGGIIRDALFRLRPHCVAWDTNREIRRLLGGHVPGGWTLRGISVINLGLKSGTELVGTCINKFSLSHISKLLLTRSSSGGRQNLKFLSHKS